MRTSSTVVLTPEHLDHVIGHFSRHDAFAFDTETTGDNRLIPAQNKVIWLSMATHGMAVSIPMGHPIGNRIERYDTQPRLLANGRIRRDKVPVWEAPPAQLRPSQVWEKCWPLFDSDRTKIAHNFVFDGISIAKYNGERIVPPPYADTRVMGHLLDENRQNGLKALAKELYQVDYDKENVGKCVEQHPFHKVARYAYMDAKYTWLLYHRFAELIDQLGIGDLRDLEHTLITELLDAAHHGAPLEADVLTTFGAELAGRIVAIEGDIYATAGRRFNLNSPKQKAEILYLPKSEGGLGLKPSALTPGGKKKERARQPVTIYDYSTDADALKPHARVPLVARLLDYQKDVKLKTTYVDGLVGTDTKPGIVFDGRVYGSFNQSGTATGRFSSSGPNLQNIPVRTADGKRIRGAFRADDGWSLVVGDQGQIELVLTAHFIGQGALFEGFHAGIDPHTMTAAMVFGVAPDDVAKDMRQVAKGLNFAIIYMAGPATVADMAGITEKQARAHMKTHAAQFPEIYQYRAECISQARRAEPTPHVRTILGRYRRLPDLRSADDGRRAKAERQTFNSKIQGSSADLIKLSINRLGPRLRALPEPAHLILTVHDELVIHTPTHQAPLVEAAMRQAMLGEGIQRLLSVPLTVDTSIVQRWSEAK
ncbi:DNA polymerase [Nonomuraea sp. NPDC059023]|uniref:DNA polymerase n=1 Tax=unclassified Nonomuraea TaxID=2593643 RepID=UPI0036C9604D